MIHEALLLGITSMGIQASLEESGSDLHGAYAGPEGIPCFSFSVKSEIRAGGRKLVGSAQRRFGRSILQHGSFLLGPQHLDLARFVRVPAGGDADGLSAWLASRTTDAGTVLGRVVTFEEARDAVAAGFTRYFSRIPEPRELPGGAPVSSTVHL
jgi:lipoate-protein ligase A